MGLSTGRVCLGWSDYSTKVYSYDDGEADPELTRFSIDHDREYIVPMLRQARQVNPDLFLFSTPRSRVPSLHTTVGCLTSCNAAANASIA
jgi:glucosylceramidase